MQEGQQPFIIRPPDTISHTLVVSLGSTFALEHMEAYKAAYTKAVTGATAPYVLLVDISEWAVPDMGTIAQIVIAKHQLSKDLRWWTALVMQAIVIVSGSPALADIVTSIVDTFRLSSPLYCVVDQHQAQVHLTRLRALLDHRLEDYATLAVPETIDGVTWASLPMETTLVIFLLSLVRAGKRIPSKRS